MKKKELEKRINDIEKKLNLFIELVSDKELKHSRIFTNHVAEEFKRNKETNRKIDKLKEVMEALLFRELTRTIDNITNLIEKDTEEQENCKKRDEIEPVEKKKGRGRPVGSKNKYNNRKGVKSDNV